MEKLIDVIGLYDNVEDIIAALEICDDEINTVVELAEYLSWKD